MTTDLVERIKKHNSGNGAKFAVDQGPFELVYVSQPFGSKSEARQREIQAKKWSHEKKLKLISREWR